MKTRNKIALAKVAYWTIRTARRFFGKGDRAHVSRGGLHWQLDLREGIDLAVFLGLFEPATVSAYRKLIRPGQTVIDIGANIGAHTLRLADAVGPGGRVIAFEPTDYAFRKLTTNIGENPELADRIVAEQIMLGPSDGELTEAAVYSSWPLTGTAVVHPQHTGLQSR